MRILEAFMDYSNPATALFRDLGGLDDTISRLKIEVSHVENGGKQPDENSESISLGTYAPGNTTRIYGSEANVLPQCLCIIFRLWRIWIFERDA